MSNKQLKNYFLGGLRQSEIEEIELRVISEESFAETMQITEDDLMEDYLDAKLTFSENALFEKNYLTTAERRENLRIFAMMKQNAAESTDRAGQSSLPTYENDAGLLRKLLNYFMLMPRQALAFRLLIVVGCVIGIWVYRNQSVGEFAVLEAKYEQINQQNFSDLGEINHSSTLILVSGNLRGATNNGSADKLSAGNSTGNTLFRLVMPPEIKSVSNYSFKLLKDRKVVFGLNKIRSYDNQFGQEIRLMLPSEILSKGQYVIELQDKQKNSEPLSYLFTVE
jgi:hypothetical protein